MKARILWLLSVFLLYVAELGQGTNSASAGTHAEEVLTILDNRGVPPSSWSHRHERGEIRRGVPRILKKLGDTQARPIPDSPTAAVMKVNPRDALTYVWIPAGTFTMGCSPADDECFDDEKPAHKVTISKGFWIGQTLVTQAAYKRIVGANPSRFKGEQLPVEMVSWDDAQHYCRAVGMRLPTEAEWEYAARAGSRGSRYGDLDAIAWYAGNSGPQPIDGETLYQSDPKNYEENLIAKGNQTHIVGQKQPNAWHLYDMLGNVWEWTADWSRRTTTPTAKRVILQDPPEARIERWAAVLGTTMPEIRESRTVTRSHPAAATSTRAFGASGNDSLYTALRARKRSFAAVLKAGKA